MQGRWKEKEEVDAGAWRQRAVFSVCREYGDDDAHARPS
jgi:hypothetical protein